MLCSCELVPLSIIPSKQTVVRPAGESIHLGDRNHVHLLDQVREALQNTVLHGRVTRRQLDALRSWRLCVLESVISLGYDLSDTAQSHPLD